MKAKVNQFDLVDEFLHNTNVLEKVKGKPFLFTFIEQVAQDVSRECVEDVKRKCQLVGEGILFSEEGEVKLQEGIHNLIFKHLLKENIQ